VTHHLISYQRNEDYIICTVDKSTTLSVMIKNPNLLSEIETGNQRIILTNNIQKTRKMLEGFLPVSIQYIEDMDSLMLTYLRNISFDECPAALLHLNHFFYVDQPNMNRLTHLANALDCILVFVTP
jgi:hypothetical protein